MPELSRCWWLISILYRNFISKFKLLGCAEEGFITRAFDLTKSTFSARHPKNRHYLPKLQAFVGKIPPLTFKR